MFSIINFFFIPEFFLLFSICFNLLFFVFCKAISNRCLFPIVVYQFIILFFLVYVFCFSNVEFCFFVFDFFEVSFYLLFVKLVLIFFLFFHLFFFFFYFKYNFFSLSELVLLLQIVLLISFIFVSVSNALIIYLCIEAIGLSFFLLTGFKNYSSLSVEAAIKYFFVGVLGSSFLLLAFLFFNHSFGFFSLYYYTFGFLFFFFSLLLKIGIPPVHFWLPDVYQGAPFPSLSLFTTFAKVIYFIFFFKQFFLLGFSFDYSSFLHNFYFCIIILFSFCIFCSLFVGNFNALIQSRIKKFLAFSSISNSGIILIPFLLSFLNVTEFSVQCFFFFLFFYCSIVLNINQIFMALRRNNAFHLNLLSDLKSLLNVYETSPFILFLLFLSLMSLAGIPPFNGFFVKFFVIFNLIWDIILFSHYSFLFPFLCFLLFFFILISVLGIFYYIRFIRFMFFTRTNQRFFFVPLAMFDSYSIAFLTIFNLYIFFFPALPWLGSFNFSFFFLSSVL